MLRSPLVERAHPDESDQLLRFRPLVYGFPSAIFALVTSLHTTYPFASPSLLKLKNQQVLVARLGRILSMIVGIDDVPADELAPAV